MVLHWTTSSRRGFTIVSVSDVVYLPKPGVMLVVKWTLDTSWSLITSKDPAQSSRALRYA